MGTLLPNPRRWAPSLSHQPAPGPRLGPIFHLTPIPGGTAATEAPPLTQPVGEEPRWPSADLRDLEAALSQEGRGVWQPAQTCRRGDGASGRQPLRAQRGSRRATCRSCEHGRRGHSRLMPRPGLHPLLGTTAILEGPLLPAGFGADNQPAMRTNLQTRHVLRGVRPVYCNSQRTNTEPLLGVRGPVPRAAPPQAPG